MQVRPFLFEKDPEKKKAGVIKAVTEIFPKWYAFFEKQAGEDGFLVGGKVT